MARPPGPRPRAPQEWPTSVLRFILSLVAVLHGIRFLYEESRSLGFDVLLKSLSSWLLSNSPAIYVILCVVLLLVLMICTALIRRYLWLRK
jgi:hypothetical protein